MNKLFLPLSVVSLLFSCNSNNKPEEKIITEQELIVDTVSIVTVDDTTPKVTGIGGIFFYSEDPQEAKEWYAKNLGIETNDWGSSTFESEISTSRMRSILLNGNLSIREMSIFHLQKKNL